MKKFGKSSYKEIKAGELQENLEAALAEEYVPTEESFEKAEFNEAEAEKVEYSNYSYWGSTFYEFKKRKMAMFLLFLMLGIMVFTFIQPYLPGQYDPIRNNQYTVVEETKFGTTVSTYSIDNAPPYLNYKINKFLAKIGILDDNDESIVRYEESYKKTGMHFWLGTNNQGQDLWALIWSGVKTSLIIGIAVAVIEAVFGIIAGVVWGYVRKLDFVFTELYNVLDNIPNTLLLILISLAYQGRTSIFTLILAMSLTGWIQMARFIRNQILVIRDRDYNTASRCLGSPTAKILVKNCLPYLVSVIMLRMALTIPAAIGSEVFVSYIGLGLPESIPSLGKLIVAGRKVFSVPELRYLLIYPTIILSAVTVSFYVIGNAFSDSADPKNHK